MISFFCRALQWGLVIAIFAKAGSISIPMVAAMLVTAWLAKRVADSRANLALAHANMRAYIQKGGLDNPFRRMPLSRTK